MVSYIFYCIIIVYYPPFKLKKIIGRKKDVSERVHKTVGVKENIQGKFQKQIHRQLLVLRNHLKWEPIKEYFKQITVQDFTTVLNKNHRLRVVALLLSFFFLCFLSRLAQQTKRKIDYTLWDPNKNKQTTEITHNSVT